MTVEQTYGQPKNCTAVSALLHCSMGIALSQSCIYEYNHKNSNNKEI